MHRPIPKEASNGVGYSAAAKLLQQTVDEERETDKKLTALAEQFINRTA